MSTRAIVTAEARRWIGTPYHHHGRVLGAGVDCVQILCAVYEAAGLIPATDPGNYARDWHLSRTEELYLQGLQTMDAQPTEHPQAGDVAMFRFGRTWSHGGILIEPDLVLHAYMGMGVILTRLSEAPLAGRPARFYTLKGLT
jgi:NlpC/P60 family putative phage cell wall peptidase